MSESGITADELGGRYSPGESALHKINPTIKIWVGISMIIAVALSDIKILCMLMLINISCLHLAGISLGHILRGLRHFTFFFLVLILFPAIFTEGTPLPMPSFIEFHISVEGMISGGTAVLRFMVIVLVSMLLTRTIHPIDLVKSLEKMTPKKYLGHGSIYEFFRVGVLSMQVIPYLFSEVEKFVASNKSEWSSVSGVKKYSKMIGLVLPFLVHIFKSMDQIKEIMENEQKA
jgi:energy-coupling factor transporter transmembrane protein EcfT